MNSPDDCSILLMESSCTPIITLHQSPSSFIEFILENERYFLTDSFHSTLRSIKDHVLLWLSQNNGEIYYYNNDLVTHCSHPCCLPYQMVFSDAINVLCKLVHCGLYPNQDIQSGSDAPPITYKMESQHNDTPILILHGQCLPTFKIHNNADLSSITSCFNTNPSLPVRDCFLLWMSRHNGRVAVADVDDKVVSSQFYPTSLSPIIVALETFLPSLIRPHDNEADQVLEDTITTSPEQQTRQNRTESPTGISHDLPSSPPPKPHSPKPNSFRSPSNILTRQDKSIFSQALLDASKARVAIEYDNQSRHMPGTPAITKEFSLPSLPANFRKPTPQTIKARHCFINNLRKLHSYFQSKGLHAPRDTWESWIDDAIDMEYEYEFDRGFMCLVVILMSSNTSDQILSTVVPRLFQSGVISAPATVEVAKMFGMNAFSSLFSESGRFYQCAERIVNAADYFIQRHDGRIPSNISLQELLTLPGVGYKTAAITLAYSFGRVEAIPSDVHVIRCCQLLGWIPKSCNDGMLCSLFLESWLVNEVWGEINPLFGAIGQIFNVPALKLESCRILSEYSSNFDGNDVDSTIYNTDVTQKQMTYMHNQVVTIIRGYGK